MISVAYTFSFKIEPPETKFILISYRGFRNDFLMFYMNISFSVVNFVVVVNDELLVVTCYLNMINIILM